MPPPPDKYARYEPRTETVTTGSGHHVRIRDLHSALSRLTPYGLRRVVRGAGLTRGVNDPFASTDEDCVRDILDLVRAMPQYCLPVIRAGIDANDEPEAFEALIRDRAFGTSRDGSRPGTRHMSAANPTTNDRLSAFFYETRQEHGEFSYFIRNDQKTLRLRHGQRFSSTEPYDTCFLVYRSRQKRYFLRWPSAAPETPAFYVDAHGTTVDFFPSEEDFEELFPGYTYEVFGVQFSVPNLGTDYRAWYDEIEGTPGIEPSQATAGDEHTPEADGPTRVEALLAILELNPAEPPTIDELARQFRKLSVKYHPLKHLHATLEEKELIELRYLEMTNAYNDLKRLLGD